MSFESQVIWNDWGITFKEGGARDDTGEAGMSQTVVVLESHFEVFGLGPEGSQETPKGFE